jgi:hypothetical protein
LDWLISVTARMCRCPDGFLVTCRSSSPHFVAISWPRQSYLSIRSSKEWHLNKTRFLQCVVPISSRRNFYYLEPRRNYTVCLGGCNIVETSCVGNRICYGFSSKRLVSALDRLYLDVTFVHGSYSCSYLTTRTRRANQWSYQLQRSPQSLQYT